MCTGELFPHLRGKVWTVCTGWPQGVWRLLAVTHYQLAVQPATRQFQTKLAPFLHQFGPKLTRILQEFYILLASEYKYKQDGGGEQAWSDGQVKSGGKSWSGENAFWKKITFTRYFIHNFYSLFYSRWRSTGLNFQPWWLGGGQSRVRRRSSPSRRARRERVRWWSVSESGRGWLESLSSLVIYQSAPINEDLQPPFAFSQFVNEWMNAAAKWWCPIPQYVLHIMQAWAWDREWFTGDDICIQPKHSCPGTWISPGQKTSGDRTPV